MDTRKNAVNYAYLVYVDQHKNHNKYYEIIENQDGSLDVNYGRVGASNIHLTYRAYEKDFYSLRDSKIRKGYTDFTSLHSELDHDEKESKDGTEFSDITESKVKDVVRELVNSYNEFFKNTYTIKPTDVNEKMLREADSCLNKLVNISENKTRYPDDDVYYFNRTLEYLFGVIPRRMGNTNDYFAKDTSDFKEILEREQELYDTVSENYWNEKKGGRNLTSSKDIPTLSSIGLSVREVTYDEEDEVLRALDRKGWEKKGNTRRYISAYKVTNEKTEENFERFVKEHDLKPDDIKLLFHGTRNQNYWSIIKNGFSLNPDKRVMQIGKMFGNGAYFANSSQKSWGYISTGQNGGASRWAGERGNHGYLSLFKVAVGRSYKPTHSLGGSFTKHSLKDGCLSVWAYPEKVLDRNGNKAIREEEIVAFDEDQMTIDYMIKVGSYEKHYSFGLNREERKTIFNEHLKNGLGDLVKSADNCVEVNLNLLGLSDKSGQIFIKRCEEAGIHRLDNGFKFKIDSDGNVHTEMDGLTNDDLVFLGREIKRTYAESESKWKKLMNSLDKFRDGEVVAINPEKKTPERKKDELERD